MARKHDACKCGLTRYIVNRRRHVVRSNVTTVHDLLRESKQEVKQKQKSHFCTYLELDVARATNVLFDQHTVVLERVLGLAFGRIQHFREFFGGLHDTHALAAAAVDGLD